MDEKDKTRRRLFIVDAVTHRLYAAPLTFEQLLKSCSCT